MEKFIEVLKDNLPETQLLEEKVWNYKSIGLTLGYFIIALAILFGSNSISSQILMNIFESLFFVGIGLYMLRKRPVSLGLGKNSGPRNNGLMNIFLGVIGLLAFLWLLFF